MEELFKEIKKVKSIFSKLFLLFTYLLFIPVTYYLVTFSTIFNKQLLGTVPFIFSSNFVLFIKVLFIISILVCWICFYILDKNHDTLIPEDMLDKMRGQSDYEKFKPFLSEYVKTEKDLTYGNFINSYRRYKEHVGSPSNTEKRKDFFKNLKNNS
ncbi:hypothetical protein [Aliarcobacter butzleri]|uniref:hypothetical protein n=1 Tax=Aliarcobacter butzleri TaxID=28197 RepID=UPI00126A68EE|nr:hypothetical protein [Aliarcobacter butzleri]